MGSYEPGWKESEKLLQAASNGDVEEISDLIANGTDISLKVDLEVSVDWFTACFCHLICCELSTSKWDRMKQVEPHSTLPVTEDKQPQLVC